MGKEYCTTQTEKLTSQAVIVFGQRGHSKQISLNKFFDPNTPSMRKVDNGEKEKKRRKKEKRV